VTVPSTADVAFGAVGAQEQEDLLRLAVLLHPDDPAEAVRHARSAILAVAGRRATGDPLTAVRAQLVRRALGPPSWRERRAASWVTDDPPDRYDGYDELRRALLRLPARTRAAVVLSRWAGLSDSAVGSVVRSPVDAVGAEIAEGVAALWAALPSPADPWRPAGTADPDLQDALDEVARTEASSVPALPSGPELAREAVRRRRRRWLAAVAVGCAAVGVAVVALSGGGGSPTAGGRTSEGTGPETSAAVDLADLPTRGSLADDAEFLAGLTELPWSEEGTLDYPTDITTAPESRRVLFAGDVPGGRWALLVGRPEFVGEASEEPRPVITEDWFMAWFTGPPGAEADEMSLASYPYGLVYDHVPAFLDPRSGTLVVLAAPGDSVEVSQRPDIDADGRDSRAWVPVDTTDGIGVARLAPAEIPWVWSVVYRVHREGRATLSMSPDIGIVSMDEEVPQLGIDFPGPPSEEGRLAAGYAAMAVLSTTGLSLAEVDITAQALAPVSAPAGGTIALVTVTLPSGAVVVSTQWARNSADGLIGGSDCGMEIRPAGLPPAERVLAARCELYDPATGAAADVVLLVVAPARVDSVRLYRGDSTFLAEHAMPEDGVLVVPNPEGTTEVEAVAEGGVLLGRTELLGRWWPSD
jgi:hypothetical protein